MSVSRRAFVRNLTVRAAAPSATFIAARGREAWVGEYGSDDQAAQAPDANAGAAVRLSSNENPLGPSAVAMSTSMMKGLQLRNLIRLRLQDVAEQLPGTVGFVIPDRFQLVYLEFARAANALGHRRGLRRPGVRQQHHEFLTTPAEEDIVLAQGS